MQRNIKSLKNKKTCVYGHTFAEFSSFFAPVGVSRDFLSLLADELRLFMGFGVEVFSVRAGCLSSTDFLGAVSFLVGVEVGTAGDDVVVGTAAPGISASYIK